MAIRIYVNGAGGTYGADLATIKPTYQNGVTWYVGNAVSTASNANAGTDRDWPLLTLQQAVTNAGAGDVIDILASHSEIISSTVTLADDGVSIVGEGIGSTVPRFTNGVAAAGGPMISVEASSVLMDNLYFPGSSVVARERIFFSGASSRNGLWMQNLAFECSANDGNRTIQLDGTAAVTLLSSTFTATGSTPTQALEILGGTSLTMDSVTFDAGSFRWSGGTACLLQTTAMTGFRWTNMSLLNGSNIVISITGSQGVIQVADQSGDSVVNWTP